MKARIVMLLMVLMNCFCLQGFAQNKTFIYATAMTPRLSMTSLECELVLDMGREYRVRSILSYNCLVDENGQDLRFKSPSDALNFLGMDGWELVAYAPKSEDTQERYILKKETTGMTKAEINTFLDQYKMGNAKDARKTRREK